MKLVGKRFKNKETGDIVKVVSQSFVGNKRVLSLQDERMKSPRLVTQEYLIENFDLVSKSRKING